MEFLCSSVISSYMRPVLFQLHNSNPPLLFFAKDPNSKRVSNFAIEINCAMQSFVLGKLSIYTPKNTTL